MATLRQLRTRVSSISNIQRVTNAMQMVAGAKMRRAQEAIDSARPYAVQLDRILRQLHCSLRGEAHEIFTEREISREALVVITSDRGLCGGFNTNLCRRFLGEFGSPSESDVNLVTVGRKGYNFFRNRGYAIAEHHAGVFRNLEFSRAVQIAQGLTNLFVEGRIDRAVLVFSEFRSVAQQVPVIRQLLPIQPATEEEVENTNVIFEPTPEAMLEILVSRHINFQVWRALLETNAGFYAAQMTAMDNATKNAGDLIEELTREMNKERQSSITLELMDIIGGAEAVS